jgi:hypothetical protein
MEDTDSSRNSAFTTLAKSAEPEFLFILHDEKEYMTVKEGLAYILIPTSAAKIPQAAPKGDNQPQLVFYNPTQ